MGLPYHKFSDVLPETHSYFFYLALVKHPSRCMQQSYHTCVQNLIYILEKSVFKVHKLMIASVIFLPARPASQTHDSHKGRMIFNHESPAGRIKNCGEKSALSF